MIFIIIIAKILLFNGPLVVSGPQLKSCHALPKSVTMSVMNPQLLTIHRRAEFRVFVSIHGTDYDNIRYLRWIRSGAPLLDHQIYCLANRVRNTAGVITKFLYAYNGKLDLFLGFDRAEKRIATFLVHHSIVQDMNLVNIFTDLGKQLKRMTVFNITNPQFSHAVSCFHAILGGRYFFSLPNEHNVEYFSGFPFYNCEANALDSNDMTQAGDILDMEIPGETVSEDTENAEKDGSSDLSFLGPVVPDCPDTTLDSGLLDEMTDVGVLLECNENLEDVLLPSDLDGFPMPSLSMLESVSTFSETPFDVEV